MAKEVHRDDGTVVREIGATAGKTHEEVLKEVLGEERGEKAARKSGTSDEGAIVERGGDPGPADE